MIQVYIDESGNLGHGGRYFVLAGIVFDTEKGVVRARRIVRKEQQLVAKDNAASEIRELKSYSLNFTQRHVSLISSPQKQTLIFFI